MKHLSPFEQSVIDFRANKLAVFGLLLTGCAVGMVICAPWMTGLDPTELQPWVGARPPGFSHPQCLAENRFAVSKIADTTASAAAARNLRIVVEESEDRTVRIALRRGIVRRITEIQGAIALDAIDLDQAGQEVHELNGDAISDRLIPRVELRVGEPPPDGLMQASQKVIFLRIRTPPVLATYVVELTDGIVNSLHRNDEITESVTIKGEIISSIAADGRELRRRHILGTDELGRDLFSRILHGGRISLLIGLVATAVSLIIGVGYGAISGYAGGKIDRAMMSIVDILYAIPFMFLVIILLVVFGRNIIILFVALGAVQWLTMARIVRGQVLSLKRMEYVAAAKICGSTPIRILVRHLIPNAIGPIIVYATLTVPAIILEESFLAFIGLSVQYQGQNLDSWGALVQQGMLALGTTGERSWLLIWPSLAMAATLFGLNAVGDGLRDAFDPKSATVTG